MADLIYNLMRAKMLTLSAFIMLLSCLAALIAAVAPFWFTMTVRQTIADDSYSMDRNVDCGIFFMDKQHFVNIMLLDKADSDSMVPVTMKVAQVFYILGLCGMLVCTGVCFILTCRTFASTTGEMCLAAATVPSALSLTLAIVLMIVFILTDTSAWHGLPVQDYIANRYGFIKILEAYPSYSMNWATYVGCIAAALALASCCTMWMQACFTCKEYGEHRYVMLRENINHASPLPGKNPGFINVGYTKTNRGEINI